MDKQVRIVPKLRQPLDLERLAEALLDLAIELEAAEERSGKAKPQETEVRPPKEGRVT